MAKIKQLPKRSEVPEALTWDLTKIFKTDADFEAEFKAVQARNAQITLSPVRWDNPRLVYTRVLLKF
ncbi:oligoendopeptidase F [Agrilactobacillus composti DSM 18527 = JCM 14202]|nr:oligoendopeptidase F [Agrilactobacillus composti DSM 18527 = JCM 14202]